MSTALQRGVFRALNRYVIAPRILSRPDKPVAQRRAAFEAMVKPPEPPPGITLETREMAGLQVDVLTPDGARGAVLYFHGGGYHIGSPRTHRRLAIDLARRSGATVYLPRYRLAPEHRFPAAVDDAAAAYGGLLAMGCQASAIVFGGDSAGGNLALCALLAATKAGRPPAGAILLSPWTDLANTGDSVRALASRDPVLTNKTLDASAKLYLGDHDPFDPACSPLYADLAGTPPILVQVGADEILLDDAKRFTERASAARVAVKLTIWPHMWHVFQMLGGQLSDADEAVAELSDFVKARVATGRKNDEGQPQ